MKSEPKEIQIQGLGILPSLAIYCSITVIFYLETHLLIPFLSEYTGIEPVFFWFLVGGLGTFMPLLIISAVILQKEDWLLKKGWWSDRLRFKRMNTGDWGWGMGGFLVTIISAYLIITLLEALGVKASHQPSFMTFEQLTSGRYWLLAVWFPFWIFNIMGEEVLWRGVILPRQESSLGMHAWILNGACWIIFHIPFGWHLILPMLPILFILPYIVQRRKNSWIAVFIHAMMNGPAFIAIALGWM